MTSKVSGIVVSMQVLSHKESGCGVGRLIGAAVDIDAEFNRCSSPNSCQSNLNFDLQLT